MSSTFTAVGLANAPLEPLPAFLSGSMARWPDINFDVNDAGNFVFKSPEDPRSFIARGLLARCKPDSEVQLGSRCGAGHTEDPAHMGAAMRE